MHFIKPNIETLNALEPKLFNTIQLNAVNNAWPEVFNNWIDFYLPHFSFSPSSCHITVPYNTMDKYVGQAIHTHNGQIMDIFQPKLMFV